MGSTTVQTDGQGLQLASTASTTIDVSPLGPNAQALDQQTHPGDQDYQILPTDRYVSTSAAITGNWTWTLPAASSVPVGFQLRIADSFGACNLTTYLTIPPLGTDTINKVTSARLLNSPYAFVKFASDGVSNWTVIDQFPLVGTPIGDAIYQMLATDTYVYTTTALTAARTWTLPNANAVSTGWQIRIVDAAGVATASRLISVSRAGSDTINGTLFGVSLNYAYSYITMTSDGISNWIATSYYPGTPPAGTAAEFADTSIRGTLSIHDAVVVLASGRNDNVVVPVGSFVRNGTPTGPHSISGIVPLAPAVEPDSYGALLWLWNETAQPMTLLHLDSHSSGANQLYSPTLSSVTVAAGGVAQLLYTSSTFWLIENIYDGQGQSAATGWQNDANTWTYASGTTFTIVADATTYLPKGTKVSYNDGGVDYGHVASTSLAAGTTTVTLITNADYSIANAALTAPRYSYADNPQGFPSWFNWTPTLSGWGANPTNNVYRYSVNGNAITCAIRQGTAGISNSTLHSISAPVTAASVTNMVWGSACRAQDNTINQTGFVSIGSAATGFSAGGIIATTANTAAGGSCIFAAEVTYEF